MQDLMRSVALIAAPPLTMLAAMVGPRSVVEYRQVGNQWVEDPYYSREAPPDLLGFVVPSPPEEAEAIVEVEAAITEEKPAPVSVWHPPLATLGAHWTSEMEAAGWPPELHGALSRIIACESGGNPAALGDQGRAVGLLQIRADMHVGLAAQFNLWDPVGNLSAGRVLYLAAGSFAPWSCRS